MLSVFGGQSMEYTVNIAWDDEAKVWIATSDDVRGLVMEAESYEILIGRLKVAVPELLELNGQPRMSVLKCISVMQQVYACG